MSGGAALDWLWSPVVALAWVWRLERRDGAVLGLTSHDAPLEVEGLSYRPTPGLTPGRIQQSSALDGDRIDIEGALTSDALGMADLGSGRWDGARLTLMAVDWSDATVPPVIVAEGRLGEIAARGGAFVTELQGHLADLDAPAVPSTSPHCRARLGDRACGVDAFGLRRRVAVTGVDGARVRAAEAQPGDAGGYVRWLSGALRGWGTMILAVEGEWLTLAAAPPPLAVASASQPARALITPGCDQRLTTCQQRFGNVANFRGEPHLPGFDLLTRYVGQ